MKRQAELNYFGEEECDALREAIRLRFREAANYIGAILEPNKYIEDCHTPDQNTVYLSFAIPFPRLGEELDVEASVTHNPHMSLQFHLLVGDVEETYEVNLESGNQEALLEVIGAAFSDGWSDRKFSEVVWEALAPYLSEGAVPNTRLSNYSSETSSPMFRTDGEGELEAEIADEIANDRNMRELVKIATQQASISGGLNWEEMSSYVQGIYEKYGTSPDLAEPADWELVALTSLEKMHAKQDQQVG